jgi:outer membrane lipoprotein-sorting protein
VAHNADTKPTVRESVQSVYLEIVKKTGELVGVTVRDPGGVGIEFRFTNWQADPAVDESLFHFRPPSGVAIVNGELPAGNAGANP